MKKTILSVIAAIAVSAVLTSCSSKTDFLPDEESLKAVSVESEIEFSYNSHNTVTENSVSSFAFGSDEADGIAGEFSVNGVKCGSSYTDFEKAFGLKKGNAMWETCLVVNEDEILFNYPAYNGKSIDFKQYDDRFLTVGYFTDEKNEGWQVFSSEKLKDAWNLELDDAEAGKINEIYLVSAGLDEDGKINMLDVYYGSYADFCSKENYRSEMNYFENETDDVEVPSEE